MNLVLPPAADLGGIPCRFSVRFTFLKHDWRPRLSRGGWTAAGMLLALAMLGGFTPMRAQATELNYSDTIAASRNFITELMAEQNIPGCTIVLVDGQDVVWAEGFGYSDKELKLPVTPTTVMPIGSVSKLLTALMVLQGVDEGALELDTSITNYLPDFSMQPRFEDQADGWTLRTLLDHHSGIPGDIYNGAFVTGDYWAGYNPWLIDYFLADYPLYPPRLLASYCNSGVNLAGEAIARFDVCDFTESAQTRIFTPLAMAYSSFLLDRPEVAENLATGYYPDGAPARMLQGNMPATGGAYSRPLDIANIIRMLLADGMFQGTRFLSTDAISELGTFTAGPLDVDNFLKPGLGLDTVDDPVMNYAGRAWLKSGSTGTFEALFALLPDHKLGAFVNINCANRMTFPILHEVLGLALLEKTGLVRSPLPPMPEAEEASWTESELQAIAGMYITKTGVDHFIAEADGTLTRIPDAQVNTEAILNYRPHANGRFYIPGRPEEQFAFDRIAGHDIVLRFGSDGEVRDELMYGGYAETLHGTLYDPPGISTAWAARCGTFWFADNLLVGDLVYAEGVPAGHMLTEANGILTVAGPSGEATLIPQDDRLAFVGGLSARSDSSVRIETVENGQERLWFGGYRGVRLEDIPSVGLGERVSLALDLHNNGLLLFTAGEPGHSVSVRLSEAAADAELNIISLETGSVLAQATGAVEWVCDSKSAVIHVATMAPVDVVLKLVDLTDVRSAMRRTLEQYPELPGFGVAAQEPGFPPMILTEGYACVSPGASGTNRPLVGDEHFHIASISKTYTAAAIFLLQQRGLLDINDCVTDYAPELNIPRADEITLDLLLQHRSGLPDANNTYWFDGRLVEDPLLEFTVEEIVDVANWLYPDLLFEPGTDYNYTDTGFNILARVVENVSGTEFQAFLEHEILQPLGLTSTFAPRNHEVEVPEPSISTYMLIDGVRTDRSTWNPSVEYGCGSLIATLEDLMKMAHAIFMTTDLLDDTTQALMMEPISPGFDVYGRGCNYVEGLGWGHDGTMWGALSTARVDTASGLRLAAVMNCQYEDERLLDTTFAIRSTLGLLKHALGYDAGALGQQPPILLPVISETRQGRSFRFQPLSFNFPTTWAVEGLPAGLSFDPTTGEISGMPDESGTYPIQLTAQNAYGSVDSELTLEVRTDYGNTIATARQRILELMAAEGTVGVSIALVDDQEIVWAEGFGYADREADIPVTPETVFRIGSLSKTFTAAFAMQYAERGLLDPAAPFTDYLPEVSWLPRFEGARPINSIDLMTHHSGLPGDLFRAAFLTQPLGEGYANTLHDLAHTYPVLPPGTKFNYCNSGFVLLEGVIAAAAASEGDHRGFSELVDDRFFQPLGMHATSYLPDKSAIVEHLAVPYQAGTRMPHEYVDILGTGSMYSRPIDLARFISATFAAEPCVLRPETHARTLADYSVNALFDDLSWLKTGLGWDTISDPRFADYGIKACWKSGATLNYTAQMLILPEQRLGVAITCSSPSTIPGTLDAITLQLALEERDGITPPPKQAPEADPEAAVTQAELDALTGTYLGDAGYDIVEAHPGSLTYRRKVHAEGPVFSNLALREDGWFAADGQPELQLRFTNANGRELVLVRQFVEGVEYVEIFSERINLNAEELPDSWRDRVGGVWLLRNTPVHDYFPMIGAGPDIRLVETDGLLHLQSSCAAESKVLIPVSDTLAWTAGMLNRGDSAVQFEEINGIEHIRYAGYLFGPAPDPIPVASTVSGTIDQTGFASWHALSILPPATPKGDIANILYELTVSGSAPNFLMQLYQADGVTPVDAFSGDATRTLDSAGCATGTLLLRIQPDLVGPQIGAYELNLNLPLLIRGIAFAQEDTKLVWQGQAGKAFRLDAASSLDPHTTFTPLLEGVAGPELLHKTRAPLDPAARSRFFRVIQPAE